jgi:hypothetical protein
VPLADAKGLPLWPASKDEPYVHWFFRQLNAYPRFAHHPPCACFDHHLMRIGRVPVCLGCFSAAVGILATVATLAVFQFSDKMPAALCDWRITSLLGVLLYSPSLIQPICQAKPAKIMFRAALGAAIVFLWYGAVFCIPWTVAGGVLRLAFVFIFTLVFKLTLTFRNKYTQSPLVTCDRGCFPICEGNRPRLDVLLDQLRHRCGTTDPEFIRFAERLVNGGEADVEVQCRVGGER